VFFDAGLALLPAPILWHKKSPIKQSLMIKAFLHEIWNQQAFDKIDKYLHPDFEDHSLPASYPCGKEGTIQWITQTGYSFRHLSSIESLVTEGIMH
jgi:hypothetical protein